MSDTAIGSRSASFIERASACFRVASTAPVAGLGAAAADARCPVAVARFGPRLTVFLRQIAPSDAAESRTSDRAAYTRFPGSMLDHGIFLTPSQFEGWFPSMAHGHNEIDATIAAARIAFGESAA